MKEIETIPDLTTEQAYRKLISSVHFLEARIVKESLSSGSFLLNDYISTLVIRSVLFSKYNPEVAELYGSEEHFFQTLLRQISPERYRAYNRFKFFFKEFELSIRNQVQFQPPTNPQDYILLVEHWRRAVLNYCRLNLNNLKEIG